MNTIRLQPTLTKENFWNEMMEKYPIATRKFCEWIDEYKKSVQWDVLFGNIFPTDKKIKFHDIPYAMQQGIWIEFASNVLNEYFEQPEYSYELDLEEDIKRVLGEIEKAEWEIFQDPTHNHVHK